jgi:hypothetical protein
MSTISEPPVRAGDGEPVYTPHEHEELRRLVARSRERAAAVVTASVQIPAKPA